MWFNWGKILLFFVFIFSIAILYASNYFNNNRVIEDIDVVIRFENLEKDVVDLFKKIDNLYIEVTPDLYSIELIYFRDWYGYL